MSSYAPVTYRDRLLPPGYRCTAYWFASRRGLPTVMCYLLELGIRAARDARWLGLAAARVPEGPFWVHTWPEQVWDRAAASVAAAPGSSSSPGPPPWQDRYDPEHPHGYWEAGDYG